MKKATRQQTKAHNARLVLRTIYHHGDVSRADIARVTHLTRPTVSRIVANLIDDHFVVETGLGRSAGGKRPTLLNVAHDEHQIVTIDLGSREFRGAVVNLRGEIVRRQAFQTDDQKGEAALHLVYELVESMISSATAPILGIGVGTPGLTNPGRGVIREAVNLGWADIPLGSMLGDRYDVPIYVANDSHMAALGEYTFGAGKSAASLLVIKIGQGVGAGAVLKGQPYYGDGHGAGEIGHVVVQEGGLRCSCGNSGCLETTTSTQAILRRAKQQADLNPESKLAREGAVTWPDLVAALAAGDETACNVVEEAGRFLGLAIANVVAVLNIHHIVIVGRVFQLGEQFLCSALAEARRRALPAMVAETEITYSELGHDVVMLGCSAMILKHELGVI